MPMEFASSGLPALAALLVPNESDIATSEIDWRDDGRGGGLLGRPEEFRDRRGGITMPIAFFGSLRV